MRIEKSRIRTEAEWMFDHNILTEEQVIAQIAAYSNYSTMAIEEIASYVLEEIADLFQVQSEIDSFSKTFDFDEWGYFSITDFYDIPANALRTALESGKCFDTGWHGAIQEFESARVLRDRNGITVSVSSDGIDDCMEQYDLFCDFLTDEEMEMLTEEKVEEIREYLDMGDFTEFVEYSEILPADATFDDVVDCMDKLLTDCRKTLHESFLECIGTTLYILYDKPENTDFISDVIKKYK